VSHSVWGDLKKKIRKKSGRQLEKGNLLSMKHAVACTAEPKSGARQMNAESLFFIRVSQL
jgi:hypothetical protein